MLVQQGVRFGGLGLLLRQVGIISFVTKHCFNSKLVANDTVLAFSVWIRCCNPEFLANDGLSVVRIHCYNSKLVADDGLGVLC